MKLSNTVFVLIASLLICSCSITHKKQKVTEFQFAKPEDVGMISDSLAKIKTLVMNFVNAKKYPGAVTLIAKNGKIIYESAIGWSDSARTKPYNKDHLFRLASMTKPITSVAAMQLIEAGKLKLDDPIGKFIPSFKETQILTSFNPKDTTWTSKPSMTNPTVRHLLTQTAGVPYGFMNPQVFGAILAKNGIPDLSTHLPITTTETMSKIGNLPLTHEPGTKWAYGLNTDVLGRVVEVASEMKLDEYIRENITKPLGIEMLDFYFDESYTDNLAKVFLPTKNGTITQASNMGKMYIANYPTEGAKTYASGGSGMTGTARAYFIFCQTMLNNGSLKGIKILEAKTAKSMHQNQIDSLSYPWGSARFGFGFDIADGHSNRPDGTYSWSGAFSTVFWIDPKNNLIVIQLRQVLSSPFNNSINNQLEQIIYSALKE
ncbi:MULTISPECIES: serine hydrolase domain-containing protein [unclassified Polaribacter]|uniref:serine hydrolase domain-containing protein n=1 Tax=unclassified Polaribacter TaxID=196858 RepID=UPI0011BF0F13|nr:MULTISPECIES: serine hydrolase domain-containing protein [unclassified Polaribacter]TXD54445.1 beta-lactamase family protein [Polaribacter sp. IC063]TXD60358.1 beta-lactamase family protein [Polaribacter sp. IC066]